MGGRVLFALSIAAFPEELPRDVHDRDLRGRVVEGARGRRHAGRRPHDPRPGAEVRAGGHRRRASRPAAAQGRRAARRPAPPDQAARDRRRSCRAPARAGRADADLATAIDGMRRLNRAASQALVASGVRAATDVTGFGLLGHGLEMARASGTRFVFEAAGLPALPGALELAAAGRRDRRRGPQPPLRRRSLDVAGRCPDRARHARPRPADLGRAAGGRRRPTSSRPSSAPSMTQASSAGGSAVSRPASRESRWRPEA